MSTENKPMTPQERIKADAVKLYPFPEQDGFRAAYIAGATAEHSRAQVLADALEWIKKYGPAPGLTVEFIDKTLREWKGEKVDHPCPHCGKELSRDRNLCCRECGKEVGDEKD